jgi:hypothetical protein
LSIEKELYQLLNDLMINPNFAEAKKYRLITTIEEDGKYAIGYDEVGSCPCKELALHKSDVCPHCFPKVCGFCKFHLGHSLCEEPYVECINQNTKPISFEEYYQNYRSKGIPLPSNLCIIYYGKKHVEIDDSCPFWEIDDEVLNEHLKTHNLQTFSPLR